MVLPDSPAVAELADLRTSGSWRAFTTSAPESAADVNGHLNVRYHFDLLCEAVKNDLERRGFDDGYRRARGHGIFTVDHHCEYRSEILVGEGVTAWVRLESRTEKTMNYSAVLENTTRNRLSSTMHAVLINVDLTTRRATDFDADIARQLDAGLSPREAMT